MDMYLLRCIEAGLGSSFTGIVISSYLSLSFRGGPLLVLGLYFIVLSIIPWSDKHE